MNALRNVSNQKRRKERELVAHIPLHIAVHIHDQEQVEERKESVEKTSHDEHRMEREVQRYGDKEEEGNIAASFCLTPCLF